MKILLVGNSQMGAYNLPRMLRIMSASAPKGYPRLKIGEAIFGGATLKTHWEKGKGEGAPRAMIAGGKWDCVVIQEIFCVHKPGFRPEFEKYATLLDGAIRKSGAKTILFATANITQFYKPSYKEYRYPDSFKKLNDMQLRFGKKHGITVAAAGYAWMKYLGKNPSKKKLMDLYHSDKGHPGGKGTYLYACLLYAVLTGRSPVGLARSFKDIRGGFSVPKKEALRMQQDAWSQYLKNINMIKGT